MLAGHDAEPGRELAAVVEVLGVTDAGHHGRGRQRADTGNLLQSSAGVAGPMPSLDLHFDLLDLPVQQLQVLEQSVNQQAKRSGQFDRGILDEGRYTLGNIRNALRHDQPILTEQTTDLVGLRGSGFDEALAHTVQREDRLLFDVLDWHKAHRGSGHGLADCLGVGHIVLVALDVGLDELRRHQPNRVPQSLQLPRPVVRTRTRLHADQAGGQIGEERCNLLTLELLAQFHLAVSVHAVDLEHVLGQIEADCRNLHGGRSFRFEWLVTLPLWHFDAVIGWGRPSHCLRGQGAAANTAATHQGLARRESEGLDPRAA